MRVFSVEMLVKEEGAATVQAALNRLKNETQAVANEMKKTTAQVTSTGRAMQTAGAGTQIAGDRAAKAAIGFAAVGQSMARTGTLTADAGTRIIEAGSQIALMFGPAGIAAAAVLSFAAMVATKFNETAANAKKMAADFDKEFRGLARSGNIEGLTQKIRDLTFGTGEGVVEFDRYGREVIDINDGLRRMEERVRQLQARRSQGMPALVRRLDREELERLNAEIETATTQIQQLQRAVLSARVGAAQGIVSPVMITAQAGGAGRALGALTAPGAGTTGMGTPKGLLRSGQFEQMRKQIPQLMLPVLTDAEKAAVDMAKQMETTFAASISAALTGGIIAGIENAIATGNISEGFKALTTVMLSGLGDAMVQFGVASLAASELMKNIQTSLASFLPGGAIAASLAMIGLGAALKGTARSAFGGGSRGGGSAFSTMSFGGGIGTGPTTQIIFGSTSATAAAGMTPRQAMNVTIIGPNDPSAQRAMQELMAKADSRGRLG
jgi:hypothetical protein